VSRRRAATRPGRPRAVSRRRAHARGARRASRLRRAAHRRAGRRGRRRRALGAPSTSNPNPEEAMARMTGGEALVQSLYREGVRVIFGLPGVQLYGVLAAIRDEPRIRFVVTRHEQATSFMADGYARAGGDFGTALVVPGPGLLNAASGLSTAYSASSPVLVISGQVPKASIGKDVGLLPEVNDQIDGIAPVTKWQKRVVEIPEVPSAVRQAVYQLRTGRPRPVELEMPPETMEEEDEVQLYEPSPIVRPAARAADVD